MELTQEQIQVVLTGTFGDGCISLSQTCKGRYSSNCKYEEYLSFKKNILGELAGEIVYKQKNGYSQTHIYNFNGRLHKDIYEIHKLSLLDKLNLLTELGIAMWFYDDGSLHKKNKFYNLNTHAFNKEDNEIISEFLNKKLGIASKVISETKKDGRKFWYIYISANAGSHIISDILSKYPINCYNYKLWSKDWREQFQEKYEMSIAKGNSTVEEIKRGIISISKSRATKRNWEDGKFKPLFK